MNLADIQELMKDFSDSAIHKMSMEWDGLKLQLEKEQVGASFGSPACGASHNIPACNTAHNQAGNEEQPTSRAVESVQLCAKTEEVAVKSPVVGVFYAAASPGAAPYVSIGRHVEKGQILCIVEAMKMMNEIPAPVSGTIARILTEQEGTVEYDQTIMIIDTSK